MSFFGVGVILRLLDRSLICPSVGSLEDKFAIFKHEGALYKGISFASSGSLETGAMHFYVHSQTEY